MSKTPKQTETPIAATPEPPCVARPTAVYTLGPKGGIGKTTTARLIIDGLRAANSNISIVQVDRAPTLPQLYPDTITIEVPSAEEMRSDPLASVRVFEPLEKAVDAAKDDGGITVTDIGAAQYQRAFLDFAARGRWDRHLVKIGVHAIALVLVTAEQSALQQSADLIDELKKVHPSAEIVPVINLRGGRFKFVAGTPAHKTYGERISPLVKSGRSLVLPATADGSWQFFEAAGMTFTEAAMADEEMLVKRLGLSRLMGAALQGDVAEFLAKVWPRLGAIVGFGMEGLNA